MSLFKKAPSGTQSGVDAGGYPISIPPSTRRSRGSAPKGTTSQKDAGGYPISVPPSEARQVAEKAAQRLAEQRQRVAQQQKWVEATTVKERIEQREAAIAQQVIRRGGIPTVKGRTALEKFRDQQRAQGKIQEGKDFFIQRLEEAKEAAKVSEERKKVQEKELTGRMDRLRRFDFKKEDFLGRTESGRINIWRTGATTLLTGGSFISAQLRLDKMDVPVLSRRMDRETQKQILSDVTMFGALSPATVSTTSLYKSAAKKSDVVFGGTAQKLSKRGIQTDVGFYSKSGREVGKKGVVRGFTETYTKGDISLSKTVAVGGKVQRGVKLPSGKEVIKFKDFFGGKEIVKIASKDKDFLQVSAGAVKRLKQREIVKFVGGGVGTQKGKFNLFYGGVTTERGSARIGGVLKQVSPKTKTFEIIGTGTPTTKLVSKSALESTQRIAAASVTATPQKISSPIVTVSSPVISSVKQITRVTPKQKVTPQYKFQPTIKQEVTPKTLTLQQIKVLSSSASRQGQRFKLMQKQPQRQKEITRIMQKERIKQIPKLKMPSILKQEQIQKITSLRMIKPTPTTPPKTPVLFSFKSRPSLRGRTATYGVRIRTGRQTYKPYAKGFSLGQALQVGVTKAKRTKGLQTFQITKLSPGVTRGGLGVPRGFKQKKGLVFVELPKLS